MSNIVILKIQDALGVFNNSSSIWSKEVFDRLRKTIFTQESARLATLKLGVTTIGRQKVIFNGFGFIGIADYEYEWRSDQQAWARDGGQYVRVWLTVITTFSGIAKLDIDKVNLELLGGLDTNQERRTTASGNNLIGEALALEDEGKGTFLWFYKTEIY